MSLSALDHGLDGIAQLDAAADRFVIHLGKHNAQHVIFHA
jgi:hypothetical protein